MASKKAHHATGWAGRVIAAALVVQAGEGGPYQGVGFADDAMGMLGGTAPNWLEVAWWARKRQL